MYRLNIEMFVRMLTVHCDQNDIYEITINGYQVRKMKEIWNVISSSTQLGEHPNFGLNAEEGFP